MSKPSISSLLTQPPRAAEALSVLVVDDSKAQRRMLSMSLERWGYDVTEAASGEEALIACAGRRFDIILSDWMMGGMSGLEFCQNLRAFMHDSYAYFILLTSKSEKAEIANGLEAGADDFLTKPVAPDELRARLRAGERIIGMQREVLEKNRLLGSALSELQEVHAALDRDLVQARAVQQTFMRERRARLNGGEISVLFRSSGHVGGDLAGWFAVSPQTVALYSIDVSGHGVASAVMSARLAGIFSVLAPDGKFPMISGGPSRTPVCPPEVMADRFNRMMLEDLQIEQYFTMAYAEVDLTSGEGQLVQAGHPHPLILRLNGGIEPLGQGGLPIGLIDGAGFERVPFSLAPGDRLFLMTDGITECPSPNGAELGEEGLVRLLARNAHLRSGALLDALVWDLSAHLGSDDFPDDVSGLLFDYAGRADG